MDNVTQRRFVRLGVRSAAIWGALRVGVVNKAPALLRPTLQKAANKIVVLSVAALVLADTVLGRVWRN